MQAEQRRQHDLVVTGASGRVGRLLAAGWARSGVPVLLQRRGDAALTQGLDELRWSPLEGAAPLIDRVQRHGAPRAMLVLAGATPGTGRDLSLNRPLTEACLAAALAAGIGRVLVTSSSAVYGGGRAQPWGESDPAQPTTPYGEAKAAAEAACTLWRARGLEVCCLRIGNVAGADALLLRAGGPLAIDRFADGGGPVRSYIGPGSLARVLRALACAPGPLPETLNIAAPVPVAMTDLASAAGLDWRWQPAPPSAVARFTLDCRALAALVPFDDAESTAATIAAQWKDCRTPT
ncbi:NAD-dependent epimerase/dehydratase family protein [Pararhodobacter sp.]|uniref:NAD-dependent epimerase/dehydratase family protein n=1 Tax=Pararhodobacter sp. TaxID=2127056 RepID=UPI002FDEDCD3